MRRALDKQLASMGVYEQAAFCLGHTHGLGRTRACFAFNSDHHKAAGLTT